MIERMLFTGFLKNNGLRKATDPSHACPGDCHDLSACCTPYTAMSRRSSFRSGDGVPSAASATRRDKKLVSHKRRPSRGFGLSIILCKDCGTDPCPSRLPPSW